MFALIIGITVLLGFTLLAGITYSLDETSRHLRFAFYISAIVGLVVAIYCAFFVKYQASPTIQIQGAPLPTLVLQLENGQWVDFTGPGWILNLVIVTSLITLPMSLKLVVRGIRREKLEKQQGFPIIQKPPNPTSTIE